MEVREQEEQRQRWKNREKELLAGEEKAVKEYFTKRGIPQKYQVSVEKVIGIFRDSLDAVYELAAKSYHTGPRN